jgi:hypothetical protein
MFMTINDPMWLSYMDAAKICISDRGTRGILTYFNSFNRSHISLQAFSLGTLG